MQESDSLLLWLVWEGKFTGINTSTNWEFTVEPQYHREMPSHILSAYKCLGHYTYSQTSYKTRTCLLGQVEENINLAPSWAIECPRRQVTAIKWQSHSPSLLSPLCYWSAQNCHHRALAVKEWSPVLSIIVLASVRWNIGHSYLSGLMLFR